MFNNNKKINLLSAFISTDSISFLFVGLLFRRIDVNNSRYRIADFRLLYFLLQYGLIHVVDRFVEK